MHREDGRDDCRDNLRDSCPGAFEPLKPHNSLKKAAKEGKKNSIKFKKTSNRYWLLTLMKNVFHF